MNLKVEAERLRTGIGGGWLTTADAVSWADQVVGAEKRPDRALIEVASATGRDRSEIARLLSSVPGEADPIEVMGRCLADLRQWIQGDIRRGREAATYLYQAVCSGTLPEDAFGSEPFRLEDAFSLAEAGIFGSHEEAMKDLDLFLERYGRVV